MQCLHSTLIHIRLLLYNNYIIWGFLHLNSRLCTQTIRRRLTAQLNAFSSQDVCRDLLHGDERSGLHSVAAESMHSTVGIKQKTRWHRQVTWSQVCCLKNEDIYRRQCNSCIINCRFLTPKHFSHSPSSGLESLKVTLWKHFPQLQLTAAPSTTRRETSQREMRD